LDVPTNCIHMCHLALSLFSANELMNSRNGLPQWQHHNHGHCHYYYIKCLRFFLPSASLLVLGLAFVWLYTFCILSVIVSLIVSAAVDCLERLVSRYMSSGIWNTDHMLIARHCLSLWTFCTIHFYWILVGYWYQTPVLHGRKWMCLEPIHRLLRKIERHAWHRDNSIEHMNDVTVCRAR